MNIEQQDTPIPEPEDVRSSIDALLDVYLELERAQAEPNHPDFQARMAAVTRQLDQYSLDEDHRRKKIAAMMAQAEERYQQAEAEQQAKPKDYLAAAKKAVAMDELARAYFMDAVDRALIQAQRRGDAQVPLAVQESDEHFLDHASKYRDMLMQKEPAAERESQDEAEQLQQAVIMIYFVEKAVTRLTLEAQTTISLADWHALTLELEGKKAVLKSHLTKAFSQLSIPNFNSLEQWPAFRSAIEAKPQSLLVFVLMEFTDAVHELLAMKNLIEQTIQKTR